MRIKLVQSGYETFTGGLGNVDFVDGLSVGSVSKESAAGIAAILQTEVVTEDTLVDVALDDTTDPTTNQEDNTGDFRADVNPAPVEEV